MGNQPELTRKNIILGKIGSVPIDNIGFKKIDSLLLEVLITSVLSEEEIDIGTFEHNNSQYGSIISYDIYNVDRQLNLKLDQSLNFELELIFYDSDDEEKSFICKLDEEMLKMIPEGLKNIMNDVMHSNKERTINPKSLDNNV